MSLKPGGNVFVTRVTKSVGLCTAVIGIFLYHVVFDKDLECTCKDQIRVWQVYMTLPVFIIPVVLLLLDGSFQVLLKYSCLKGRKRFRRFLLQCIFRAFFIGLLWPISVMIDGDWYACYYIYKNLYCGEFNLRADGLMIMKELKYTSRIIGFSVLIVVIALAAILRFPWKECCTHESNKSMSKSESKYLSKDDVFVKILLEEGANIVTNELIEVAKSEIKEKLKDHVSAGEWLKCYDVVDEIIKVHTSTPTSSEYSPNEATASV